MKLVWLPRAVADLQEARAYIAEHDPKAARAVAQKIRTLVAHLKSRPRLGRPADVDEIRQISVPGLPYLIPIASRMAVSKFCVYSTPRKSTPKIGMTRSGSIGALSHERYGRHAADPWKSPLLTLP
jgi:toxin ParE1/3/4